GGEIPSEYLTDIRNGVQEAMQEGVVAGFPVIDVGVTLLGGSYHEVDSSGNDFKLAAKLAFKDACSKAPMTILEPIGSLEVRVPSEHIGAV
ncbi:elongation factor G, partial [Streptomyces acidiscabies]